MHEIHKKINSDILFCMNQPDWNHLHAFLETAECGSLSAAARKLGLTQPTLSRQVAALEASLGVTLFERVGKAMALTESGLDLLEHTRAMGAAADALALAATGRSQAVEGVVTVSASDMVATYLLPPLVKTIRARAPGITVELIASNALSDLRRREADIAVRHVPPQQPDLIARLLRQCTAHAYASRDWALAHGHPRRADEATALPFVGSDRGGHYLAYLRAHGLPVDSASFTCHAENSTVQWALVRQGLGIGFMLDEIAAATPDVVRVLDDMPPIEFPLWLVTHRELRTSRRMRLVFGWLAEGLTRPACGPSPATSA